MRQDAQFCLAAAAAAGISGRDSAHQNGVDARLLHAWGAIIRHDLAVVVTPVVRLGELVELERGNRLADDRAASPPRGVPIARWIHTYGKSVLVGGANFCRWSIVWCGLNIPQFARQN
jgi:hypothetical protein